MLKITKWKELNTLPITPVLLEQLKQHLLAPFNDEKEAQSTWTERERLITFGCVSCRRRR
ncbi:MAG: hypothetical protein ACI88H_003117 [Cocleimonas sp.]|jgi:hypothetical protein